VAGDTNATDDIFVRDRVTGVTERVSVASDGTGSNNFCQNPWISSDGRFVVFSSHANNLVTGDTNGTADFFLHDRETGLTERVSVASGGTQSNGISLQGSISDGGRYVAFQSDASNLVTGDTNSKGTSLSTTARPVLPSG